MKPNDILNTTINAGVNKAAGSFSKLFILAILAGAYIALAGAGANMAAFNLLGSPETFGLGKLVSGFIFPIGLMMVMLCGAELFTGNCLMLTSVVDKKIKISAMARNWVIVYIGNLIGGILIAWMVTNGGMLSAGGDMLGAITVKIAAGKVNMPFLACIIMGILCNWLVCLAVWMATGADSTIGKIGSIFFPICLFVVSGFEHSVANMYYIPAGLFAKANASFVELSGVSSDALSNLNWGSFFVDNLLPVTMGNIIGGAVFVGLAYYFAYKKAK